LAGHPDVVLLGASAGGVETLKRLVATFDATMDAAVFVVLHVSPDGTSVLPGILSRAGPFEARHVTGDAPIEHGCIYVAPPDHHLELEESGMRLSRAPTVNGHRPSIDRLFSTAADALGPRVIGVVLSGTLDDGTLGLRDIVRRGGSAIVQDPNEALFPAMPASAASYVPEALVLELAEIGPALLELTRGPLRPEPQPMEELARWGTDQAPNPFASRQAQPGRLVGLTCPECNGAIWETEEDGILQFRCRIGHAYSAESFVALQRDALEKALLAALRALDERVALTMRLARRFGSRGKDAARARYARQAREMMAHADVIRSVLEELEPVVAEEDGMELGRVAASGAED